MCYISPGDLKLEGITQLNEDSLADLERHRHQKTVIECAEEDAAVERNLVSIQPNFRCANNFDRLPESLALRCWLMMRRNESRTRSFLRTSNKLLFKRVC